MPKNDAMNPRSFFGELKRRNVYKVAVAYAIVGWLLVQIATQVFPFLEIPTWVVRSVIALVAIGFPIALVIAWAFEATPEGIKRTEDVDPSAARGSKKHAWIYITVIGAAFSIGLFFVGRYSARNPAGAARTELPAKSIAVLPFVNMSADKTDEYLSDGVSEELITALSKITGLQVKARTSSFAFKGKNEDIQKIGELLHVSHLLEGSVAKAGNKLRITAQLIQASDGNHLWSDTYDREMQDIFAVRSEVAQQVAGTLRVRLLGEDKKLLDKKPTENLKAFQYYMQGVASMQRRTSADLLTAVRYYEKALEEDPKYALAYAGLADAYANSGYYGAIAPIEGRRKAEEAARHALALDENLAEAHAALGLVYIGFTPSQFSLGERELRRASELSPSLSLTPYVLGLSYVRQGRLDEALPQFMKARELDPLSSIIARAVVIPYYFKRDYARAFALLRQANELGPALSATWEIGLYIRNGSLNEAFTEIEKAKGVRKNDPLFVYSTGMAYAAAGKQAEALQCIKELEAIAGANLSTAHWIAKVYATLNDKEMAFSWLERGLGTGALGVFYKDEPVWDPIRDDPRFAALVGKMVVPETAPKQ
jgi:TolB-like protein/tetratricopeptide (TPR) repeat protein